MAFVLCDADVNGSLGALKLRPRLEQIERGIDLRRAWSIPRHLKIPAPQPSAKARAADRPRLAVPVDHEVRIGDIGRGMKQRGIGRQLHKHSGGRGYEGVLSPPPGGNTRTFTGGS